MERRRGSIAEPQVSVEEWRMRLAQAPQDRATTPAMVARRLSAADDRFADISRLTRSVLRSPALAATPVLSRQAQRALELSRLLHDELYACRMSAGKAAPTAIFHDLLIANEEALFSVQQQLGLLDALQTISATLHPVIEAIVAGSERSAEPLRSLANVLLSESPAAAAIPLRGVSLIEFLERAGWNRSGWFAQAFLTARLLATTIDRRTGDTEERLRLVMAAMVQDIGAWHELPRQSTARTVREGVRRLPPHHPSTSAAIVQGLVGASAELMQLVGAHHERCDGSGFPRRLRGRSLSAAQQRLAFHVRYAELLLDPLTLSTDDDDPAELAAGLRLWSEIRRGGFDEALAVGWLNGVRPGLAEDVARVFPERQLRYVDRPHLVAPPHVAMGEQQGNDSLATRRLPVAKPAFLRRGRRQRAAGVAR